MNNNKQKLNKESINKDFRKKHLKPHAKKEPNKKMDSSELDQNITKKKQKRRKKFNPEDRKYRISIIEGMKDEKVKKYGFERSYIIFEKSINRLQKEGDEAEEMALQYLQEQGLLGENYSTNRVIVLGSIKIEADIIDYDNKIIYETKSRKTGKLAKQAVIKKWKIFEYDKANSLYKDFQFKGIVVANYNAGKKVKGIVHFEDKTFDPSKVKDHFDRYFERLSELKKITKEKK